MRSFWSSKFILYGSVLCSTVSLHSYSQNLWTKKVFFLILLKQNWTPQQWRWPTFSYQQRWSIWNLSNGVFLRPLHSYLMNLSGEKTRNYFWKGRQEILFLWLWSGPFISPQICFSTTAQRLPNGFTGINSHVQDSKRVLMFNSRFSELLGIRAKTSCPLKKTFFCSGFCPFFNWQCYHKYWKSIYLSVDRRQSTFKIFLKHYCWQHLAAIPSLFWHNSTVKVCMLAKWTIKNSD